MNVLILEDSKERIPIFNKVLKDDIPVVVETAKHAIDLLKNKDWDLLFLDHDLGGQSYVKSGENTGWEVAKWLEEHPDRKPNNIIIHSLNTVGQKNMKDCLPEATVFSFLKIYDMSVEGKYF